VGFMAASSKLSFEEIEIVWPYMSSVAELMSPRSYSNLYQRRKDQTLDEKRTSALLAARCHSLRHEALLTTLEALRDGTLEEGDKNAMIALQTFQLQLVDGGKLRQHEWGALKTCCEEILLPSCTHVDDVSRELARAMLDVMRRYVGTTCAVAWDPADRPLKKDADLTPPSPQIYANGGVVRGAPQSPALMSQRNWIAEQLPDSHRNLAHAPLVAGSSGRVPSSVGSEAKAGRAGTHDVHPAVAIVETQGHYYDQMMKLPFELLSSQIVSRVMIAVDEGSLWTTLSSL